MTMTFIYLRARDGLRTLWRFLPLFSDFSLEEFSFARSLRICTEQPSTHTAVFFLPKNVLTMKNRYKNIAMSFAAACCFLDFPVWFFSVSLAGHNEVPTRLSLQSTIHPIRHESLAPERLWGKWTITKSSGNLFAFHFRTVTCAFRFCIPQSTIPRAESCRAKDGTQHRM